MKRFMYLLNAIFLLLFTKSFIFANDLESKVNYLLELSKNNISQANSWMSLLRVLTTVFAFAFVTVIIFILAQLYRLVKQVSANKRVLQTIEKHGESLTMLARDTEEIRNQIRDQSLMSKGVKEENYGNFLKEVLKMEATPSNMNMIRNLVWTLFKPDEYESGLKRLREIFGGGDVPTLMAMIKRIYTKTFQQSIAKRKLLTWIYEIKEKNKKLEDLLNEEKRNIIYYQKGMREFYENLPPVYPERKLSHLEQIFNDLSDFSKEKKSGE